MVNATWIAARPQWYFWSIGLTNSVQPYCRLAIITMQMMPKISWPQRPPDETAARAPAVSDVAISTPGFCSLLRVAHNARHWHSLYLNRPLQIHIQGEHYLCE